MWRARITDVGTTLHASTIQRLFATALGLSAVARQVDDEEMADTLRECIAEIDQAILEIQEAIASIRGRS